MFEKWKNGFLFLVWCFEVSGVVCKKVRRPFARRVLQGKYLGGAYFTGQVNIRFKDLSSGVSRS